MNIINHPQLTVADGVKLAIVGMDISLGDMHSLDAFEYGLFCGKQQPQLIP